MKILCSPEEIVNTDLWRLFPVINCDKVKDIPSDYVGAIGVPITILDKMGLNDGHSGFELIDQCRPSINGKIKYQRFIVRNLKPDLPDEIDLLELMEKSESEFQFEIVAVKKEYESNDQP